MRKRIRLSAIAILAAAPIVTGSALLRGSDADIAVEVPRGEVLSAASAPVIESTGLAAVNAPLGNPIDRARERVTLKPFGIEIHPGDSPVPNDRFDGTHVGVDFETFAHEQDIDVPIFAICDGPLQFKVQAKGYGGVAVQACLIDTREVSVIYGHLALASIEAGFGKPLSRGDRLSVLGRGYSEETDGVRKHLHLGIRDRIDMEAVDIRGYVHTPEDAALYIDALKYLPQ